MALKSGLSIYCYTSPTSTAGSLIVRNYSRELSALHMTTVMPGGYGTMTAMLNVPDARVPRPEFALFSRVVVTDGTGWYWLGEISDPKIGMNNGAEYISISALGIGNSLRDNDADVAYTNQTIPFMAHDLLAKRNFLNGTVEHVYRVDSDNSYLFPSDPGGTYSVAFTGKTFEEVLGQFCVLAGSQSGVYDYAVWAHPLGSQPNGSTHQDAARFPLAVVYAQLRDTATTHYQASVRLREVSAYEISPSGDRAYNNIAIRYNNGSGGTTFKTAIDSRLSASKDQQTAPFPARELLRDYSGNPLITSSQAQGIANALLTSYQNVTNKISVTVKACRDAQGNPLPLWQVSAGKNIFVPEMAVRSLTALPTAPTATINQFFIISAEYTETQNTDAQVVLQCDNWIDKSEYQIARLQMAQDAILRAQQVAGSVQVAGTPLAGQMGVAGVASASNQGFGAAQTFPRQAMNTPTQVVITSTLQNTNATAPTMNNITAYGFMLSVSSTGSGQVTYVATYSTNGNCLRDVDRRRGTFTHHCDECERRARLVHGCGHAHCAECAGKATRTGLSLKRHLRRQKGPPGQSALTVDCPGCGGAESFNTALGPEREREGVQGWEQARQIRKAMRHVGLEVEVLEP